MTDRAVSALLTKPDLLPLRGVVQHYDWGGYRFLPDLLGEENREEEPFAELWIGAHPGAPAIAYVGGLTITLDRLFAEYPEALLGSAAPRFSYRLPYLLKVLDARKMLSIQAHPTKRQAQEGFARENAAGIDLKAAHRNYKDDNHKPEVHVALTDFWMLHGFRPLEEIAEMLRAVSELAPLMPDFTERLAQAGDSEKARKTLLRDLYARVMRMPQEQIDSLLSPLLSRLRAEATNDKDRPDFWALRAADYFPLPGGHLDRGIISIYLLNLVRLRPGQGTYQPAGTLHAYLEGANVELMANSDNVLRGGLTPKYVDTEELMRLLTFESGVPAILEGEAVSGAERVYRTPATEFELSRIALLPGQPVRREARFGPDTILALEGSVVAQAYDRLHTLQRGDAILAPCGISYVLEAVGGPATLFRAIIPETVLGE
jgi:mannose-6-phosphate isomerase